MNRPKVLIICVSAHHNNTVKLAVAISEALKGKVIKPVDIEGENLADYDLIGFGSGIYNGKHHQSLFELVSKLQLQEQKKAFIFSTATVPVAAMHKPLKESLAEKGFEIIGEFSCKGFMNYTFTKYFFGGLNKGRPNYKDLKRAQDFAAELIEKVI